MRLLRSLLTFLLRMLPDPDSVTASKVAVMPTRSATRLERASAHPVDPLHECVDRPWLPCPACFKATGDEFATAKSTRPKFSKTGCPAPRSPEAAVSGRETLAHCARSVILQPAQNSK